MIVISISSSEIRVPDIPLRSHKLPATTVCPKARRLKYRAMAETSVTKAPKRSECATRIEVIEKRDENATTHAML